MFVTIIVFLVILSVLVLAHEAGHYFTAKKFGAKVEEFGIGFPPRLYSWPGKDGMKWSINLIPIGGFVKIKGESGSERNVADSFSSKSLLARAIILSAGVFMNMVLAVVLLTIAMNVGIPAITENTQDENIYISDESIRITQVLPESPGSMAGLQAGDIILTINDTIFVNGEEARSYLSKQSENSVLVFKIERQKEEIEVQVVPNYIEEISSIGVGIAMMDTGIVRYPWYTTPLRGVEATVYYTSEILQAFGGMIKNVFKGQSSELEISGPVGIAVITGEFIQMGISHLLQFAAILSINLAIINILPFPALDGGRLVFVIIEAIRRKPNSQTVEMLVHNFGFLLLMALVIFVTYRDIIGLF